MLKQECTKAIKCKLALHNGKTLPFPCLNEYIKFITKSNVVYMSLHVLCMCLLFMCELFVVLSICLVAPRTDIYCNFRKLHLSLCISVYKV